MSIFLHYLNHFAKEPSPVLCNIFRAAAYDTWERIAFSRSSPRLKIHETTITQNLVYELNQLKHYLGLSSFSIYESTNEKTNGDDLEIIVNNNFGGAYKFAIQAKILYHKSPSSGQGYLDDGFYRKLEHKHQVDLLLDYAKKNKAIPLYLLYNFVNNASSFMINPCSRPEYLEVGEFGCSLASAHYLRKYYTSPKTDDLRSNVKYSDLHPIPGVPWMILACCVPNFDKDDIKAEFYLPESIEIFNHLKKEISSNNWFPLSSDVTWPPKSYQPGNNENSIYSEASNGFSPKYQIWIE